MILQSIVRAISSTARSSRTAPGLSAFARIANRPRWGITSRRISSRLPARSGDRTERPVMLPPGRAKLATSPAATGSMAIGNTTGTRADACFAASTGPVPAATMMSTSSRTNSAAISAKRSIRPWAQRYSIVMVCPSTHPSSCNRRRKGVTHALQTEGVAPPRKPIVGSLPTCCARAANGHAPRRRVA